MFVWTYSSHDAETNIFHLFFLLITNNNNTGLQGPSLRHLKWRRPIILTLTKNWNIRRYPPGPYALPKVFNGRGWACSPFIKDTESDIPKSMVCGVTTIISPTSINNSNTLWRDTRGPRISDQGMARPDPSPSSSRMIGQ